MARSVLIVDDDPAFRELVGRMLRAAGLRVAGEAHDAGSGARSAEQLRPEAILVDVGLPDRSGVALARDLARRPWAPSVLLVSTDPDAAPGPGEAGDPPLAFVAKADLPNAPLARLLGGVGDDR